MVLFSLSRQTKPNISALAMPVIIVGNNSNLSSIFIKLLNTSPNKELTKYLRKCLRDRLTLFDRYPQLLKEGLAGGRGSDGGQKGGFMASLK